MQETHLAVQILEKLACWPVVVLLFFVFFTLVFRKHIAGLFKRALRIRKGDTELEVAEEPSKTVSVAAVEAEKQEVSPPPPAEAGEEEEEKEEEETRTKTSEELWEEVKKAVSADDFEKAEGEFKKMQEATEDPERMEKNEVSYRYLRYRCGDTAALGRLQKLAESPCTPSLVHEWIGHCHKFAGDLKTAEKEYELALEASETPKRSADLEVMIARTAHERGKREEGIDRLMRALGRMDDIQIACALYEGLAELYEKEENWELRALTLEKALQGRPDNIRLLFDTAYSCDKAEGMAALALLHYKTLLGFKPEQEPALNNAGVEYATLGMPIRATESYRKAASLGNTLAAANLAYTLMKGGLHDDALKLLEDARKQEDVHPNVGSALATLSELREKEEKRAKMIIDWARRQQEFLLAYAEARFVSNAECPSFAGKWVSPIGVEITVSQKATEIEGYWHENETPRKLTGTIHNRAAAIATYVGRGYPLLETVSYADKKDAKAYISSDGSEMHLAEYDQATSEVSYYELRRTQ